MGPNRCLKLVIKTAMNNSQQHNYHHQQQQQLMQNKQLPTMQRHNTGNKMSRLSVAVPTITRQKDSFITTKCRNAKRISAQ